MRTITTRLQVRLIWAVVAALAMALFGVSTATAQSASDDPAQVEAGRAVYEMGCAGCHGDNGQGTSQGRPLTDIASQEPDRSVHIMSVTDGKGSMPALGDRLDAEQIDAVVSYVRLSFVSDQAGSEETTDALAETGVESGALVVIGMALLAGGGLMVMTSRRITRLD